MPLPASSPAFPRLRRWFLPLLLGAALPWPSAAAAGGGQEYRAPAGTAVHSAQLPAAPTARDGPTAGSPPAGGLLPADWQTASPSGLLPCATPQRMPQAASAGQAVLPPEGLPAPPENRARTQGTADLRGNNFSDPGQALQWRDPQTGDVITAVVPPRQTQQQNPGLLFIAPQVYPNMPPSRGGQYGGPQSPFGGLDGGRREGYGPRSQGRPQGKDRRRHAGRGHGAGYLEYPGHPHEGTGAYGPADGSPHSGSGQRGERRPWSSTRGQSTAQ